MFVFTDTGKVTVICVLLFFLIGFVNESPLMYIISLFCAVVITFSVFLAWLGLRGVEIRRQLPGSAVFSNDPMTAKILLTEKRARWRILELYDLHTNLITEKATHRRLPVMTLGGRSRSAFIGGDRQQVRIQGRDSRLVNIQDTLVIPQRGQYRLGPLTVYSYDPFGLVFRKRTFRETDELVVYPHPFSVPEFVFDGLGGKQTNEVRPVGHAGEAADFHSIRPYEIGDDLRRVHWKTSAHTGKLVVKEYEYLSSGAVQLVLDLQHGIHCGNDEFSSLEAAVSLSASMLHHVLHTGDEAGLLTTGAKVYAMQPESGQRQLHRALEALALARDDGNTPLTRALSSGEGNRSGRCSTIVVTPTVDKSIIVPLLSMRGRSGRVLLVLLNARSFFEAEKERNKNHTLLSIATQPLNLKKSLRALTEPHPCIPTDEEHLALQRAAASAGIDVCAINTNISIHQALQSIHSRMA